MSLPPKQTGKSAIITPVMLTARPVMPAPALQAEKA